MILQLQGTPDYNIGKAEKAEGGARIGLCETEKQGGTSTSLRAEAVRILKAGNVCRRSPCRRPSIQLG